jgi:hypothetical protein
LNQYTVARGATVRDVCGTGEESGDRKDAARRKFDHWAVSYERDRRSRFNARPQQEALAALELESDDRFLDVGCGTRVPHVVGGLGGLSAGVWLC